MIALVKFKTEENRHIAIDAYGIDSIEETDAVDWYHVHSNQNKIKIYWPYGFDKLIEEFERKVRDVEGLTVLETKVASIEASLIEEKAKIEVIRNRVGSC